MLTPIVPDLSCSRFHVEEFELYENETGERVGDGGHMKICARILLSLMVLAPAAQAQNFSIDWFTVAGGGMKSRADKYVLNGTVGQAAAGAMTKGNYSVVGGFWSFSAAGPASGTSISADLAGSTYAGIDLTDPAQAQADLDGDGVSNLMEYALGSDPRNPADGLNGMQMSLTNISGSQYLTLSFKRRKTSSILLQYIPESSADVQTWSSANLAEVNVTTVDSQFDWVTVMDMMPTLVDAPRFIRLRVVEN